MLAISTTSAQTKPFLGFLRLDCTSKIIRIIKILITAAWEWIELCIIVPTLAQFDASGTEIVTSEWKGCLHCSISQKHRSTLRQSLDSWLHLVFPCSCRLSMLWWTSALARAPVSFKNQLPLAKWGPTVQQLHQQRGEQLPIVITSHTLTMRHWADKSTDSQIQEGCFNYVNHYVWFTF